MHAIHPGATRTTSTALLADRPAARERGLDGAGASHAMEGAMTTRYVDVAVIGAGTAGLNARHQVAKDGGRPLLIEDGPYGTTCARVGCMPSKLLIAAADAAHAIEAAPLFGIHATGRRIDGPAVLRRVRRERDRFAAFAVEQTEAIPDEQRLRGHARFVGPSTLLVDDRVRVEARTVVVAVGSRPVVPPPFDRLRDALLTSDDVFELQDLPESLAVIGTGVIALELGQAMQRLGVRVAFFNPLDEVGLFTDPQLQRAARRILGETLDLRLAVSVTAVESHDGAIRLAWTDAGGTARNERFAAVLVAAGRTPRLDGLALDATGLPLDARGIPPIDRETMQCADAPIFFAGDADGYLALLHEASDEGRIAGANAIRWPAVERHARRTRLAIAFCDPQMASVGLSYDALPPERHAIGSASWDDQGRARVIGRNRGLVRIAAEAGSCRLLGAELLGPEVEHLAHLLAWAVQRRMTVGDALAMPFYHPTLEEGLRSALRDLAGRLRILEQCRGEDLGDAPGA
jgi:dihydrolipoamide dehydrogenase